MDEIAVSELVLDFDLYPRHEIDSANLRSMTRAVEAGTVLPPVIADRQSRRVIDGFHRVTMYRRTDELYPVPVEWMDYDSDGDMLLDAMARNASHGVRLTRYDQARCLLLGERLGIDEERVAAALSLTVERVGELRKSKIAVGADGKPIEIKATARHLAGRRLSKRQQAANEYSSGMSVLFHARQVINAVEGDLVNWDDKSTQEALLKLAGLLAKRL